MSNYTITLSDGVTQFTVYSHEVDGLNVQSTPRAIQSVDINLMEFTLAGDLSDRISGSPADRFYPGFQFDIINSDNLNGTYTVAAPGATTNGTTTTIPVVGFPFGSPVPSPIGKLGAITYTFTPTTSLSLPGRGVVNYGEHFASNFVHLLETFASNTPPVNPLTGQLWFDTTDDTLYQFDGTSFVIPNAAYIAGVVAAYDELSELLDVDVAVNGGPNDGDLLRYNNSSQLWENHQQTYEHLVSGASQTVFNTSIPTESNVSGGSARLQVFVNGVYQLEGTGSPPSGSYTVTGPTQITFTSPVPDNADVVIYSL